MWDALRLWLPPQVHKHAHCLQTSAVELALPASCGQGRPPVLSVMRVLRLSRLKGSENLCKDKQLKTLVQARLARPGPPVP
eukprot:4649614-Amphidinium_carterae.2